MEEIAKILEAENDFLIATHVNPDGDALGSALALAKGLEKLGKKTILFSKDGVPEYYEFLPGSDRFVDSLDDKDVQGKVLVLIDCNTLSRIGLQDVTFRKSIVIDHHETESNFGDVKWVVPDSPAVGLMIFNLLKRLEITVTPEMAINLYAAIAVDTGTFRYPNTTPETLRTAAELLEAGVKPGVVADRLYRNWTQNRFTLLCENLSTIEITDSVGISTITEEMFQTTFTTYEDTENFVNYPLMMNNVQVSALFREVKNNTWKVSLRSKGKVNVASVAALFDGGGHKNAAGYQIKADINDAKRMLLEEIRRAE